MRRAEFARRYGPWALVAGGSRGLGAAFADELARRGVNLLLVARGREALEETAARLRRERAVEVVAVTADLADLATLDQVARAASGLTVGLVVANAALAPSGPLRDAAAADLAAAVDLNCRASMLLAHMFLPAMTDRGAGGIVLVSSLAGLQGVPGLATYSATKAFLISLGEALWAEHRHAGVDVLTVCPGAVSTPGYQQAARRQAPGTTTPEMVAAAALEALGRGFRVVPGGLNRLTAFTLQRLAPRRAAIAIFGHASAAALKEPATAGAAHGGRLRTARTPGKTDNRDS